MEKEIDLTKSAANFLVFLRKNILLSFVLVIITSGLVSYIFYSGQISKKAEVTVLSSKVPFQFIDFIFRPVKTYVNNGDFQSVSKVLNVEQSISMQIGSVNIEKIEGLTDLDFKNGFTISLVGKSEEALVEFGNKCIDYLNSNEFIEEWKKVYTDNLLELEKTASEQIDRLDSVQQLIPLLLSKNSIDNANFDIGSVYEQMIILKDHKEEIIREIKFNRGFKVVSTTFYPVNKISKKIFLISLTLINLFVLLLSYYIYTFIQSTRSHFRNR